ncbi:PREDICTED: uncharacterized protein LOC109221843 [Nicotiana attenuata]|uniref:uncharacterized protein LOC109221843 n=1 Tax=Nicotiana attenuata TaxID=49451 RepID=UPI000905A9F9|nr:PREDICTED: uncharacterized protein LOC109221843 [Nicotiana attenuata]
MAVAAFQNGLSRSGLRVTKKLLSRLMKYPSTTWDETHNAYYAEEWGHKTKDFIALRQEVVNMLHQGHLKELMSDQGRDNFARGREQHLGPPKPPSPVLTIQMIIGGGDDASIYNVKFTTTHKLKRSITHERRIMVNDGSGACIIHPRVLTQMKLEERIVPRWITLIGFNNAVEQTSGEITLPVLGGGLTLVTTFHIMDQDTAYNAIIGRPWIHAMEVIPSSLYQVIKVPIPWGVFCIRREQRTTRECYRIAQDCTYTQQFKGKAKEA